MSKRAGVFIAVALLGFAPVAQAAPVQFTVSSISVTDTNYYDFTYQYPSSLPSFTLDTNGSWTGNVFQISSARDFSSTPGDQTGALTMQLHFSNPLGFPNSTDTATLLADYRKHGSDQATITWGSGDPYIVSFGNGGQLRVDMSSVCFSLNGSGGSAWVGGTFTLVQSPAPVPEPASMLLLGTGLLGLAGLARRRTRA